MIRFHRWAMIVAHCQYSRRAVTHAQAEIWMSEIAEANKPTFGFPYICRQREESILFAQEKRYNQAV